MAHSAALARTRQCISRENVNARWLSRDVAWRDSVTVRGPKRHIVWRRDVTPWTFNRLGLACTCLRARTIVRRDTRWPLLRILGPNIATRRLLRRAFRGHRSQFRWGGRLSERCRFQLSCRQVRWLQFWHRRRLSRTHERGAVARPERRHVSHDGPRQRLVCRYTGVGKASWLKKCV